MKPLGVVAVIVIIVGLAFIVMSTPNPISANFPGIPATQRQIDRMNQLENGTIPSSGSPDTTIYLYYSPTMMPYFTDAKVPSTWQGWVLAAEFTTSGEELRESGINVIHVDPNADYWNGTGWVPAGSSDGGSSSDISRPREGSGTPLSMFGFDITISLTMGLILVFAGIILFLLFGM